MSHPHESPPLTLCPHALVPPMCKWPRENPEDEGLKKTTLVKKHECKNCSYNRVMKIPMSHLRILKFFSIFTPKIVNSLL